MVSQEQSLTRCRLRSQRQEESCGTIWKITSAGGWRWKTFLIQEIEGKKPETGWSADKARQLLETKGSRGPFPEGKTAACIKDLAVRLWQRDEDNRESQSAAKGSWTCYQEGWKPKAQWEEVGPSAFPSNLHFSLSFLCYVSLFMNLVFRSWDVFVSFSHEFVYFFSWASLRSLFLWSSSSWRC